MKLNALAPALIVVACLATLSRAADATLDIDASALEQWGSAEYVVIAKLESVQAGPVGFSEPPLYTHRLKLVVEEVLRGPAKKSDTLQCSHSARQRQRPTFPEGKRCLVAAGATRGSIVVSAIEEASEKSIAQAKLACSIPIGWTVKDGKLVSPWASMGDKAWSKPATEGMRCGVTGRPALLAGPGIAMSVSPVPPVKEVKYSNPDGDGAYTVTITNTTDKALHVPALLTNGKEILWHECVLIVCQNRTYTSPSSKGVGGDAKPVKLDPGQSVSCEINALALQGPEWPRGGYRIEFQFCLGELSGVQSFYYMSRHHDPIRAKLKGQ